MPNRANVETLVDYFGRFDSCTERMSMCSSYASAGKSAEKNVSTSRRLTKSSLPQVGVSHAFLTRGWSIAREMNLWDRAWEMNLFELKILSRLLLYCMSLLVAHTEKRSRPKANFCTSWCVILNNIDERAYGHGGEFACVCRENVYGWAGEISRRNQKMNVLKMYEYVVWNCGAREVKLQGWAVALHWWAEKSSFQLICWIIVMTGCEVVN